MEMLAVVVIIGVLSSVALPQYRKVVEKSKFTKAQVMAKAMYDSCERLVAEWGVEDYASLPSSAKTLSRLDIGDASVLPPGFTLNAATNTIAGAGFSYVLNGQCGVSITKTAGNYSGVKLTYDGRSFACSNNAEACNIYGLD